MDTLTQVPLMVGSFIERSLNEINSVSTTIIDGSGDFNDLVAILDMATAGIEGFTVLQYYALHKIKTMWDETREDGISVIPSDFKARYDNNFYQFAYKRTGGKKVNTIESYMSTAEVFLDNGVEIFGSIPIPVRDMHGKPTGETEYVEWNPSKCSISKLLICRSLARSGELGKNEKILTLLMDSGATVDDVKALVYGGEGSQERNLRYFVYGDWIVAKEGEWERELFQIDPSIKDDPQATEALLNALSRLGTTLSTTNAQDLLEG